MPKRITVTEHSSIAELEQCYKQATGGVESRQFQTIWLLAKGKKTEEVEEITGYSRTWIYALVKRYNDLGIEGLGDFRHQNQGAKPLIDDVEQAQLWQVLQAKAPDGGLWNGRKVAEWLTSLTGRQISRQRGWEILRQMTFRLRVPRPSHTQSDETEQQAWKKTSNRSQHTANYLSRSRNSTMVRRRTDARRLATASLTLRAKANCSASLRAGGSRTDCQRQLEI